MKRGLAGRFGLLLIAIMVLGLNGCQSGDSHTSQDSGIRSSDTRSTSDNAANGDRYLIGVGIYDITGPASEVTMGGFAFSDQKTAGISMRLWARSFIIADPATPARRVVFVNADTWAMCQSVKQEIARRLAADPELSPYYNNDNVCLSATHSHSSVAGFSHYFLYNVPNLGFIQDSFDAVTDGIFASIKRAHANLRPGRIYIAQGNLAAAGWNRSSVAYDNNPAAERAAYDGNIDTTMTVLKFVGYDAEGREVGLGMLNWFAVHPDCIGPSNHLISGDSKGHAAYLFEKHMGGDYTDPLTFVAAFAQSNSGDVTPNVPFTTHAFSQSDAVKALKAYGITDPEGEIARQGFPWDEAKGEADIEENLVLKLEATLQYRKALELYQGVMQPVHGSVDYRHKFVDMRSLAVDAAGCSTCPSGMGASYSYGSPCDNPTPYPLFSEGVTRDDVGAIDWNSGTDIQETLLATLLPGAIGLIWPTTLSKDYIECQGVKPVILPTGLMTFNLVKFIPLMPQVLPVQVLKIGNLVIAAQPTEITTMAGRRVKNTLLSRFQDREVDHAVIAGLSNTYASYLATGEEYGKQGYEGAGTMFGPHELEAFQQEYAKLCDAILAGTPVASGPFPLDLRNDQFDFSTAMPYDEAPSGKTYGQVISQPAASYSIGDKVKATFQGANPRNNRRSMDTFLTVEQETGGGYQIVRRDWDPDTKFIWERGDSRSSTATIVWNTSDAEPGRYVIRYHGDYKTQDHTLHAFEGASRTFVLK
ncbi:MAG: neutral/alkaline non-lysosomal ceramidase N-terminal domain-containing protein [Syntrophaceae bacterium]